MNNNTNKIIDIQKTYSMVLGIPADPKKSVSELKNEIDNYLIKNAITNTNTIKYSFKNTGLKILRGAGFAILAGLSTYLTTIIPEMELGDIAPIIVSLSLFFANVIKEFISESNTINDVIVDHNAIK